MSSLVMGVVGLAACAGAVQAEKPMSSYYTRYLQKKSAIVQVKAGEPDITTTHMTNAVAELMPAPLDAPAEEIGLPAETMPVPAPAPAPGPVPAPVVDAHVAGPHEYGPDCHQEKEGHCARFMAFLRDTFERFRPHGKDDCCHDEGHGEGGCLEGHCGDDGCGRGRFIAGAGFLLIQPRWENNKAFGLLIANQTDGFTSTSVGFTNFDYDYELAPRVWGGWVGCDGFGVRGSFWFLDQSANAETVTLQNPGVGESLLLLPTLPGLEALGTPVATLGDLPLTLKVENDLELHTLDLEATQILESCGWAFQLSGGARYSRILQTYRASGLQLDDAEIAPGVVDPQSFSAVASNRFEGIGPTVSAEARRALGYGISVFGNVRGSLLFGTSRRESTVAESATNLATGNFEPVSATSGSESNEDVLPVGEVEVGAEWSYNTCSHRYFIQTGWVGQVYHNLGSATDNNGNLGFTGLSLSAGIQF
jgi:hypothetical protein